MTFWIIDKEATKDHWLELTDAKFELEECWPQWSAVTKWDGCTHLHEKMMEDGQYLHLCGVEAINEMIARLEELKQLAKEHFKTQEEWK